MHDYITKKLKKYESLLKSDDEKKPSIILDKNTDQHPDWKGDPSHLHIIDGLHIDKPTKDLQGSTITSSLGEGIRFVGKGDDQTTTIIKGPVRHPSWDLANPDKVSHFGENSFTTSHREAAFYEMSKFFGMDRYIPETTLFKHPETGSPWSAMKYVDGMSKIRPDDKDVFNDFVATGDLHKMAIMDMILGNNDRHWGNFEKDPAGNLHFFDHGLAFDYSHISTDVTPRYAESIKHEPVPDHVMRWLTQRNMDTAQMATKMHNLGAPHNIIMKFAAKKGQTISWLNHVWHKSKTLNTLDTIFGLQASKRLGLTPDQEYTLEKRLLEEKMKNPKVESSEVIEESLAEIKRGERRRPGSPMRDGTVIAGEPEGSATVIADDKTRKVD